MCLSSTEHRRSQRMRLQVPLFLRGFDRNGEEFVLPDAGPVDSANVQILAPRIGTISILPGARRPALPFLLPPSALATGESITSAYFGRWHPAC
jgi:hypothetical protein